MSRVVRSSGTSRRRLSQPLDGPRKDDEGHLKIGVAAKLVGVKPYVLRFWETEFPLLKPHHTASRHRLYGFRDVELLRLIKRLLYQEGFTIEGARKRLKELGVSRDQPLSPQALEPQEPSIETSPGPSSPEPERQALRAIRRELESLYELLRS